MDQNKMLRMAAMAQLHLHGALWVTRNKVGYWYAHIEKPILNKDGIWIRNNPSDQCRFLMSDDDKSDESILCLSTIEIIYPSKEERVKFIADLAVSIGKTARFLGQNEDGKWVAFEYTPSLSTNTDVRRWIYDVYNMDRAKAWYITQTSPPEDMTKEIYNIENGVEKADICGETKN